MANYDINYALNMVRQAADFAEAEHDFRPLRKWIGEAEKSAAEEQEPKMEKKTYNFEVRVEGVPASFADLVLKVITTLAESVGGSVGGGYTEVTEAEDEPSA
jgi:hypothetical protein